jgi:hypothetical protein
VTEQRKQRAAYPVPEAGMVISYSFLWSEEAQRGKVEGRKDRPCAIVMAVQTDQREEGPYQVAVVPITHVPHHDASVAMEIPGAVKRYLGLDGERSWVVLDEFNVFTWPGYDLRPIKNHPERVDYGFLPPKLFEQLIQKIEQLLNAGKITQTSRDDLI